jgi:hypothetical protein
VLDITAQNIAQNDYIRSREFVQAITLSVMRVDAKGMRPTLTFLAERSEQRELQLVTQKGCRLTVLALIL